MVVSELIGKVHRNQFGGEKILMLMDTAEQEEAFFRYENNFLVRQSGYYIYYEKNTQMQNYMLEKNPEIQEESQETVQDDAVRAFRSLIQKRRKKNLRKQKRRLLFFLCGDGVYRAGTCSGRCALLPELSGGAEH